MALKMFIAVIVLGVTASYASATSYAACPPNEIYTKCVDAVCWKTCEHLRTKPPCAAIADCNKPACVCKKGFLRNERGVCVPINNCPASPKAPQCPANEVFTDCIDAVCWKTCDHLRTRPPCASISDCNKPGCVCTEGFLRNARGICVPTDYCPAPPKAPQCPANEVFTDCIDAVCWKTCDHLRIRPPCASISDCNKPGCVCTEGFLRNARGICVPTDYCPVPPKAPQCPANEVFTDCIDAVCWKTCDHLRTRPPCASISDCNKPGCVCTEGFLRNARGICVPTDYCPAPPKAPQCPVNEVFTDCIDAVCWKTCDHLRTRPPCASISDCNKPGCVCTEGFLRNARGICVPTDYCPAPPKAPQCPANEVFTDCIDAVCWKTCDHLRTRPPCASISDCNKPGCVCTEGFLRNARGICVPTDYCPAPPKAPQCPANEVFTDCIDAVCWKTCDHLRTRPPCASISDCNKPGCVCTEGFLRNARGICVPTDYCPE